MVEMGLEVTVADQLDTDGMIYAVHKFYKPE